MKKNAILIGIENYLSSELRITSVPNDIKTIRHKLAQIEFNITEFTDLKKDSLVENIRDFIERAECDSVNVIYFTGHGFQYKGVNYIVPSDFKIIDAEGTGCSLDDLLSCTCSKEAKFIFIIDACRDNIDKWLNSNYCDMRSYPNVFIAYATQFNLTAGFDEESHFTRTICNHILTPNITIQEMFLRIRTDMYNSLGGQLSNTVDCLLAPLILNEVIYTNKTDEDIYKFIEKYGEQYTQKHGYFDGEIELFIDATQIFNIGLLDAMYMFSKVSNKEYRQKLLPEDELKWVDLKYLIDSGFKEEKYNWYFKGRRVRMGEIPLLPLSMQKSSPMQGKEIIVKINVTLTIHELRVKSNLPDGFILNLNIKNLIYSQSQTVKNGKCIFKFGKDAERGKTYQVDLTSPTVNVMTDLNINIVGESGRNLSGGHVSYDELFGNMINYSNEHIASI